jgi:hypothetical protein
MPFIHEAGMVSPYSRRVFLTYSAQTLGSLPTLIAGPWIPAAEAAEFAATFKHLRPEDIAVLLALLPIALGVGLDPAKPEDRKTLVLTLQGLDHIIDQLPERNRDDLMLLLNLLSMPLARTLLGGLLSKKEKAPRVETEGVLDQWERTTISLKRFGYQSLVQLMEFVFDGVKAKALTIRYPAVPPTIEPLLRRFSAKDH